MWMKLTEPSKKPIFLNMSHASLIRPGSKENTWITFPGLDKAVVVKEDAAQILHSVKTEMSRAPKK